MASRKEDLDLLFVLETMMKFLVSVRALTTVIASDFGELEKHLRGDIAELNTSILHLREESQDRQSTLNTQKLKKKVK